MGLSMTPWERDYKTRTWKTYQVEVHGGGEPELRRSKQHFIVCSSDSQMAESVGYSAARFYVDYEMVAADIDPIFGGDGPYELANEWRGHSVGSLIYRVYSGMKNDPPTWTYMIQV